MKVLWKFQNTIKILLHKPCGSDGKDCARNARDPGFEPWARNTPGRRTWQPTPVLLPAKSLGQRSLMGYSPRGHKELDMTD